MTNEHDSRAHLAAQSAQIRTEAKETALQQAYAEAERKLHAAEQREQSIKAEEKNVTDLIPPGTTRDQLLQRIREMRAERVEEPRDYYLSPEQQEQLRLEQEEGRRMVAKAEAEAKRISDARMIAVAVENASQGDMTPVHHPNPDQQEQYPAIKATLGKPNDRVKTR